MILEISNVATSPHGRLTHGVRIRLAPSASSANYRGVSFLDWCDETGGKKGIDESQARSMKRRIMEKRRQGEDTAERIETATEMKNAS